ncbi:MAG: PEP-CTERM sorting domain-containing protein, partial [Puniceicoccales bacterium]
NYMKKRILLSLILVALTPLSVFADIVTSVVNVTLDTNTKVLSFDFTGMAADDYFESVVYGGIQTMIVVGSAGGSFSGETLISNSLVDKDGNAIDDATVNMFIYYTEGGGGSPLISLGIGTYGSGLGSFTVGGGTISYDYSDVIVVGSDLFDNFPISTMGFGTFEGAGDFTVNASLIPEPSTYAPLTALGVLGYMLIRRRRCA